MQYLVLAVIALVAVVLGILVLVATAVDMICPNLPAGCF